jgi:ferredoxin
LIFGNRAPGDAPFATELRRMARKNPAFRVVFVYSDAPGVKRVRHGFIDRALLADVVAEPSAHSFFLCGPEPMLALVRGELEALGLPRKRVRSEDFGPPSAITAQAGWPEGLSPVRSFTVSTASGEQLPALAGEPLLVALERAGLAPRSTCRTGACGDCRVRLRSGRVLIPEGVSLRQSDRVHGYVHACMAWPLEDCALGELP